jgi:hypothetical protein
MITVLDKSRVLRTTRTFLGLPGDNGAVDDELTAAALRRLAAFTCPCPASTLARVFAESFAGLVPSDELRKLRERATELVEQMVVQGDLLELSDVTSLDPLAGKLWVFAAPPAFVARPGGTVILLGIVPDEPSALPAALSGRVKNEDGRRTLIQANGGEDLAEELRSIGLVELSEDAWLKPPREEGAEEYLERHSNLLSQRLSRGQIEGLEIINPSAPTHFYRGRWTEPRRFSGDFIGRRPQTYGAPIWGMVRLADGVPSHFLDLPISGARYRGCDAAWRLQAAIDAARGSSQMFRVRAASDGCIVDFFGPIPSWAARRFYLIGREAAPVHALLSFWVPESEIAGTREFLRQFLWLSERNE